MIGNDLFPQDIENGLPNGIVWAMVSELLLSIATYRPDNNTDLNSHLDKALNAASLAGRHLVSVLYLLVKPTVFFRVYNAYVESLEEADKKWCAEWDRGELALPTEESLEGNATDSYDGNEWVVTTWSLPPSFRAVERLNKLTNSGIHMRTGPNKRTVGNKGWTTKHLKNGGILRTGHARYQVSRSNMFTIYLDFTDSSGESLELASFTYTRGFQNAFYKNEPKGSISSIENVCATDLLRESIGPFGKEGTRFEVQTLGDPVVNYNPDNIEEAQERLRTALVDYVSKPARRQALTNLTEGQLFSLKELKAQYVTVKAIAQLHGGAHAVDLASKLPDPDDLLSPFVELRKGYGHADFDPTTVPRHFLYDPRPSKLTAFDEAYSAHSESFIERVHWILARLS